MSDDFGLDTVAVHVGQESSDPATGSRVVPIYQTSSYIFNSPEHASNLLALGELEASLSSFNAFLSLQGSETLALRQEGLSIGIEDAKDIIADIDQSLAKAV